MHFYINCGFLLFFGGCLILSDMVSLFFSWHSTLVYLLALRFTWLVLFLNLFVVFSVVFITCGAFFLFIYLFAIYLCYLFNLLNLLLWYCSSLGISWAWSFRVSTPEKVRGNKARGLQTEEVACKWQTLLFLLSGGKKQTIDILFFLLNTNLKGSFS